MKIEKNRVVRFHYTVSEPGQPPVETSRDREPLAVLIGHGNIIEGLEEALAGREAGRMRQQGSMWVLLPNGVNPPEPR